VIEVARAKAAPTKPRREKGEGSVRFNQRSKKWEARFTYFFTRHIRSDPAKTAMPLFREGVKESTDYAPFQADYAAFSPDYAG